jgi:Fe-Mn family superoxide dismutase
MTKFTLPDLEYDYDALGKYISKDIMTLHHTKHHQAYVDKLNAAVQREAGLHDKTLLEILRNVDGISSTARNNAGGHYNHSLFWQWMTPNGGGEAKGQLAEQIDRSYGSFQNFVDEFTAKSLSVFGSGWCWLQPDMAIITTPNQDNPIMLGFDEPILGLDVWEHAYYLDYKNKRDDYIAAWWNVVDWDYVASRCTRKD